MVGNEVVCPCGGMGKDNIYKDNADGLIHGRCMRGESTMLSCTLRCLLLVL